MVKNKFLIYFFCIVSLIVIIVFFNSMDGKLYNNFVKSGGEIVEKIEKELSDTKKSEKIGINLKEEFSFQEKSISPDFLSRFYLSRATYLQSQAQYEQAIKDLDFVIKSKGIERDLAFINKAVVYEKMGQKEAALLIYEDISKNTQLDFIKIRALLSQAILIEEKDKNIAVKIYEEIAKFPYENNLYVSIANNKLLELK